MSIRWKLSKKELPFVLVVALFIVLVYVDYFLHLDWLLSCIIGGGFTTIGLVLCIQNIWMHRVGRVAQATVVGYAEERSDDEMYYFPIVEFSDQHGRERREKTDAGRGIKKPEVSARVLVKYDPAGKLQCQIIGSARWFIPIGLVVLGGTILTITFMK